MGAPRAPLLQAREEQRAPVRRPDLPPRAAGSAHRHLTFVFAVIGALIVFAIAAAFVGSAAFRLGHQPTTAIFDLDEAVEAVADGLTPEPAARLTYDEVRQIVRWYLDDLAAKGMAPQPGTEVSGDTPEVTVADDDAVARVIGRAEQAGMEVEDGDVFAVVGLLMAHLVAIGAIGPPG